MTADDDELLTVNEIMRALRCGRSKVYDLIRNGHLDALKIVGQTRVTKASLRRLLKQSEQRR
jgi:excisionase family DNA binding protein